MVFHPGFMWLLRARRTQLQRALLSIAIAPVSSLLAAGLNAVHHPVSPIGFEPSVGGYRNQGGQYQEQYASTPGAEFVAVTEGPIRALVCMCGHPIQVRKLRRLSISARDWGGFQKSFESARCTSAQHAILTAVGAHSNNGRGHFPEKPFLSNTHFEAGIGHVFPIESHKDGRQA
jgi:hypothetical protein